MVRKRQPAKRKRNNIISFLGVYYRSGVRSALAEGVLEYCQYYGIDVPIMRLYKKVLPNKTLGDGCYFPKSRMVCLRRPSYYKNERHFIRTAIHELIHHRREVTGESEEDLTEKEAIEFCRRAKH